MSIAKQKITPCLIYDGKADDDVPTADTLPSPPPPPEPTP